MPYRMYKTSDKVYPKGPRDGTVLTVKDGFVYSLGGWTSDIPIGSDIKVPVPVTYNDIYRSSGDLSLWEFVGYAEWTGRHTFGMDRLGKFIFAYCGDDINPVMDMWSTEDGINWNEITHTANMAMIRRILYGSCSDGSYIYIIGGMDKKTNYRSTAHDVWRFDGNRCEKMGNGLSAFEKNLSGAACYFNRKLWVISGGTYGTYTGSQEVYSSYDYGANWRREPDIPFPGRQYHNTIVWDDKLWVIAGVGGEKKGNLKDIWYMEVGDWGDYVWTEFKTPDEFLPRHASGVCVYNNKLVITNGNYHNDCWIIEKQL